MKIITICGSLKFQKEMMEIAEKLSLLGVCVLTPVYLTDPKKKLTNAQKNFLKASHFEKIELCDSILVVNIDKYIGSDTQLEIDYAKLLGKEINYLK